MKAWKTVATVLATLVLLFAIALAAAPFLFRDRIADSVTAAINRSVDARVEFGRAGVSLLRSFPNLTFSLADLTVTGVGAFDGDTLAHVPRFRLVVDLGSAWRAWRGDDPFVVRSITVDRPYLHARVLADGTRSWDILKAAGGAADAATPNGHAAAGPPIAIALRRLAVTDARVALDDASADIVVRVDGLDHSLRGDFSATRFVLRTRTAAERVAFSQLGVPYLAGVRMDAQAELDADMEARRFTFRDNRVGLNELGLAFAGAVALLPDDMLDVDLTFAADRADFRHLLSLVPALYLRDFPSLEAGGTVAMGGHVRGRYGPDDFPAFALDLDVADGMFRYADLPVPATGILVDLKVANPGGDADLTRVDLSRFGISFGDDRFEARASVATPVSDPELELALDGRIDLAAVARAVPLEGVDELRGIVTTDVSVRARRSWLEAGAYDRVAASGNVHVAGLVLRSAEIPHPIEIDEMRLALSPQHADLRSFRARIGSSDFQATGRLDNLLGFALLGEELRGRATLRSDYIDLAEWQSDDDLEIIPVPAGLDLALSATIDRMTLDGLEMTEARGAVRVSGRRVTLDDFGLRTLDGQVVMTGYYETLDLARPAFDFDFAMTDVDVAKAFTTFNTVRVLAPAAGYATGRFSADLRMGGDLGADMVPHFEVLNGRGTITTRGISLHGMPALHRIADGLRSERFRDPSLSDFTSSLEIRDGRMHVHPFDVRIGGSRMNVSGSNGIDQSLDYRLLLEVPRSELGAEANAVVSGLLAESGRLGVNLATADAVRLDATIGGTMARPAVRLDFADAVTGAGTAALQQAGARTRAEVDRRADDIERRVTETRDEAADEARARARAEADRILADAEAQAARIRGEAERAADAVRREGHAQADRLLAEATGPVAQRAARPAADRLRREADERAAGIIREADRRADDVLAEARRRAEEITGDAGG